MGGVILGRAHLLIDWLARVVWADLVPTALCYSRALTVPLSGRQLCADSSAHRTHNLGIAPTCLTLGRCLTMLRARLSIVFVSVMVLQIPRVQPAGTRVSLQDRSHLTPFTRTPLSSPRFSYATTRPASPVCAPISLLNLLPQLPLPLPTSTHFWILIQPLFWQRRRQKCDSVHPTALTALQLLLFSGRARNLTRPLHLDGAYPAPLPLPFCCLRHSGRAIRVTRGCRPHVLIQAGFVPTEITELLKVHVRDAGTGLAKL